MQIQYLYQIQEVKNQYMYYATNEFFAPCEENEIAYFQENVLANLEAFAPQGVSWQEGEQDALQRQEECWTKIQSLLNEMTEKTGQITNGTSE